MLRKFELFLGDILGNFILLLRFKHRTVRNNLENTNLFNEDEIKQIIKKNYKHYGRLIIEFIHIIIAPKHFVKNYVRGHNFAQIFKTIDKGKGVFLLVGHIGNWEVCAWYGIHRGIPLTVITKHIKNKLLEFIWSRNRKLRGMNLIYDSINSGGFKLVRALKKGNAITYVLDQHTYPPLGIKLDFFSNPAWTLSALAKYVQKLGTPVVPISCYRDEKGYFDVTVEDEVFFENYEDKELEIIKNTLVYNECLENMIKKKPAQWIWLHRRWKNLDI